MGTTRTRYIVLGTCAYVVASFAVQSVNHFVLNADHYAAIMFARPEPIMAMGVGTMLVQGALLAAVFGTQRDSGNTAGDAMRFALAMGLFLGLYIAVVEPSKYAVPSIPGWIAVEATAATVQFALYGWLLGRIGRPAPSTTNGAQ